MSETNDAAEPARQRPRVRPLAILSALGAITATLAVAYALFAWLIFDLFGESWLNRRPDRFLIQWKSVRMSVLEPGEFDLEGLELRGRTRLVRWSLSIDKGTARLSLPALLERQIQIDSVTGAGIHFAMRRNQPPLKFPGPPASPPPATKPPVDPAVAGATPPDPAAAPPGFGPRPAAPPKDQGEGEPPPDDPSLPTIEGFAQWPEPGKVPPKRPPWILNVDVFELAAVRELWIESYRYRADGADGKASGKLSSYFRQSIEVPIFAIDLPSGRLDLGQERLAQLDQVTIRGALDPTITRKRPPEDVLRQVQANLDVTASRGDIGVFQHYLRGSQIDLGGEGKLDAKLVIDHGRLVAGSKVDFRGAGLRLRYFGYLGEGRGRAWLEVRENAAGFTETQVEALLEEFEVGLENARQPGLKHLRGKNLRLVAHAGEVDVTDPQVRATIDLPETKIPDLRIYNAYMPERLPLELVAGEGLISSHFEVDTAAQTLDGKVLLRARGFRARLEDSNLVGDLEVATRIHSKNLDERVFELRGTHLSIDRLQADWYPPSTDWWARFEFPSGRVALRKPLELEADVTARLSDSAPILALLLKKKPAVGWLENSLTAHDLDVHGHLTLDGKRFAVRDLSLRDGGKLRIDAQLEVDDGHRSGLFHVDLGLLAAGLAFDGEGIDWKLRQSRPWYEERIEAFWKPAPPR